MPKVSARRSGDPEPQPTENDRLADAQARALRLGQALQDVRGLPLSRQRAAELAAELGMHWTSIFRLRRIWNATGDAAALLGRRRGSKPQTRRLSPEVEAIVAAVLQQWRPRQVAALQRPAAVYAEVQRRCLQRGLKSPGRNTIARRLRWPEDAGAPSR